MAEAPGDKKGQDASKKGKKKRPRNPRKKSRKQELRPDAQAQRGTNAGVLPKGKERAKVGRAENLPKAADIANSDDSAKLTELRPSLLELRESFKKTAPKHQVDSAIKKASKTSTMASGQSQTTCPPYGHVSVSKESSGGRTLLRTLRNIMSGQSLAYCVVALVVLALAVLAVILTAMLSRLHAMKREVSSPFTASTNPPQRVKGVVGMGLRGRTALTVP
ncbi:hypothetical protein MTO96_003420 [Rhipicephalus appendiculatus]